VNNGEKSRKKRKHPKNKGIVPSSPRSAAASSGGWAEAGEENATQRQRLHAGGLFLYGAFPPGPDPPKAGAEPAAGTSSAQISLPLGMGKRDG